ncbi:MAG: energy-coupling factor ABC transporter permease [Bryobacteraceae bacterium]
MHISEGFLPLSHCIGWAVASLPPTVLSVRMVAKQMEAKRENRVLLAASAAFLFTLSSLRMPSLTGSSSHPTGVAVGTYLFGPEVMPALALITLIFQALLLAHGGLTTLGANLFSLGVVGPWVTWLFLQLTLRRGRKPAFGIFVATVVGDLATYITTAVQLAVAYPSAHGGFLASFLKFTGLFFITQIPISIAEGMLTVALLGALSATQMAALQGPAAAKTKERAAGARAMAAIALLAGLVLAIAFANRNSSPVGSDDQAERAVTILRPGYRPIATSFWIPGPVAETILFGFQGAAGVAILAWAVYSLRKARKQTGERVQRHMHLHPHLNDIAFTNHWRHRNPWEKVLFGGGFLVVALLVPPTPGAILITLIVSAAAIAGARIPISSWLTVLSVPVSFAILTAVGILIQIGGSSGFPVTVDWSSLPLAIGLLLRSTAAICCLAFIGWTTPLMELIPVFGRLGIPNVLIDLALMIYHFLFVTATTLREMRRAQSWRLGRADYRSRMRALSMLASGLFIRCIDRFRRLENGIESRGYEGRLWVLAPERGASFAFIGGTIALQAGLLVSGLALWKGTL